MKTFLENISGCTQFWKNFAEILSNLWGNFGKNLKNFANITNIWRYNRFSLIQYTKYCGCGCAWREGWVLKKLDFLSVFLWRNYINSSCILRMVMSVTNRIDEKNYLFFLTPFSPLISIFLPSVLFLQSFPTDRSFDLWEQLHHYVRDLDKWQLDISPFCFQFWEYLVEIRHEKILHIGCLNFDIKFWKLNYVSKRGIISAICAKIVKSFGGFSLVTRVVFSSPFDGRQCHLWSKLWKKIENRRKRGGNLKQNRYSLTTWHF